MGIIDFSFDIHPVAYAIANIVNCYDFFPIDAGKVDIKTFPFYNGRERNICITVRDYGKNKPIKSFHIIFGEYRNSDNIAVMTVKKDYFGINPLTINDMKEEDWNYKHFKYNNLIEAADYIKNEIEIAITYFNN